MVEPELPATRCRGVPSQSSPLLSQRHCYGQAAGCSGSAPLGNGQREARQPHATAVSSMSWTHSGGASTRPPPQRSSPSCPLPAARCRGVPSLSSSLLSPLQRHHYGRAAGCSGSAPLGKQQLGRLMPRKPPPCRGLAAVVPRLDHHRRRPTPLDHHRWQPPSQAAKVVPSRWCRHSSGVPAGDNPGFSLYFRLMWKWKNQRRRRIRHTLTRL